MNYIGKIGKSINKSNTVWWVINLFKDFKISYKLKIN